MVDLQRETLGNIWRLCEQMAYSAEHGLTETLRAEFDTLQRQMERLRIVEKIRKEA